MPSPRREELDKGTLARVGHEGLEVVLGQLDGRTVNAGAVELTKSNFKELVADSGKAAFVKFLAPW